MTVSFKNLLLPTVLPVAFVLNMVSISRSEIVVFDRVTTVKTPVRIKVLTKSRFFPAGGRLVDIYLDDDHQKKILTGGDGYGYLKYTPQGPGLKKVTARSISQSASGLILVMRKPEKAILVEIEEGFKDTLFSDEVRKNSLETVDSISKKYKIIYLTRYLAKGIASTWLEKQNFPKSVILRWRGPQMLAMLQEKGVKLHAIIGSSAVTAAAAKYIEKRYTFEKTKEGKTVENWNEILKLLQEDATP